MRMASAGCALKPHAHTVQEYARQYPQIGRFAALYTMLRYRTAFDRRTHQHLAGTAHPVPGRAARRPQGSLLPLLRRTLSLRALYY